VTTMAKKFRNVFENQNYDKIFDYSDIRIRCYRLQQP